VVLGAGWVLLFPGFQVRYHHARSQAAARDLVALASSKGMTAAQLAQAWAASRSAAGSCVKDHVGSREGQLTGLSFAALVRFAMACYAWSSQWLD